MTPERIAELRTILDADLLDQGTAFYMACDDLPQALDTIEAQAALIAKYHAEQSYSYIGKDGKSIKARDLEDQRDELAARSESQQRRIEELGAALKRLGSRDPFRVFNDEISARIKFAKYALQPKGPS